MTTKTIRKLEVTCQRLENALRRTKSLLAAARQRALRREDHRRDRKYLALGYAVDAAMSHIWTERQTRAIDQAVAYIYQLDDVSGTTRIQRIRRGVVVCAMLLSGEIPVSDIETAALRYLPRHQQTRVLHALADREALLSEIAQEIAASSPDSNSYFEHLTTTLQ